MPCCGDFIRRNLPFAQEEMLEEWVRQRRGILSPPEEIQRKVTDGIPWSSLGPRTKHPAPGDASLPWCFVLSPHGLPFAVDHFLIGVWMDSSDKVGRRYPVIMIQTAARRWIRQYFASHAEHPCEWLFHAARLIARSVYAQKDEAGRPADPGAAPDQIAVFQARLNALWTLYAPDWRNSLGKRVSFPGKEVRQIQDLIGPAHPEDPARHWEGVRFLPWADWPDCLPNSTAQGFFWQQNLHGRFISAIRA
jgi:type VI secretion system protein ImpM